MIGKGPMRDVVTILVHSVLIRRFTERDQGLNEVRHTRLKMP